jgi:hypothetical protein
MALGATPEAIGRAKEVSFRPKEAIGRAKEATRRGKEVSFRPKEAIGRAKEAIGRAKEAIGRGKEPSFRPKEAVGPAKEAVVAPAIQALTRARPPTDRKTHPVTTKNATTPAVVNRGRD